MIRFCYLCIAPSTTIAAIGFRYLIADELRFGSREPGKPWQHHPLGITGQGC
jgi:hypothetical protein